MSYFEWLCSLVCSDIEYTELLAVLDSYDYVWHLLLDENRARGGLSLREKYASEIGIYIDDVRTGPCTVLEMLIALSELMSDQIDGSEPSECFWMMVDNLGLRSVYRSSVHAIIQNFLSNNYSNEHGGLFPLKDYYGDVRGLDLYSQMNAWLETRFPHQNIF